MNATLHAFASIYRDSAAGRTGAVKDYTLDWERFLRLASCDDGDARELAEQDMIAAERASQGLFVVERNRRSGVKEVIRLKRDGGEAWLFEAAGIMSPTRERQELAGFFQHAADIPVPADFLSGWRGWFEQLAIRAQDGKSVAPFKRESAADNTVFLNALAGVINWRGESLIRYASAVICGDSKTLENFRPRLLAAMREITGRDQVTLEDFGISEVPRSVLIHGPLVLHLPEGRVDFGMLAGPVGISAIDLSRAQIVECPARLCLTVENESVFRELAKKRLGVLLVHTSFPGAATRLLFERLPKALKCQHFGDSDPAGFDILRDLRERTGRQFMPILMQYRPRDGAPELTDGERRDIARLLSTEALTDVHEELLAMQMAGIKGEFEQESLSIEAVLQAIQLHGGSVAMIEGAGESSVRTQSPL